jgi:hypothetical protein
MPEFPPEKIAAARKLGRYLRSMRDIRDEGDRQDAISDRLISHFHEICEQHNGCFTDEQVACLKDIVVQLNVSLVEYQQPRETFFAAGFDEWRRKSPLTKVAVLGGVLTNFYDCRDFGYPPRCALDI